MTATRPPGYDDRSAAPVEASRRGAHRARPKTIAALLPVLAGVAVVLLVLGAVYTVASNRSGGDSSSTAAGGLSDETEATATATATAGGKGGDKTPTADDDTTAEPTAEASATEDAGAGGGAGTTADQTIPVVVLNSLDVGGLASTYKAKLEAKDWTVSRTDNSVNRDLATTKIYYQDAEMKASALAVKKAIGGIGTISENASVNAGSITVVLGQDSQ
ncbi:hypothetical protein GCM10022223_57550 [Kineosporia mesophila]|uniref:LytR/CpsA/Psr regulator C-terminal domain-containing protein n=1 Tax=Kineosporia mesophila TaxID=566012 RepID=A0ABP7AGX0_9ACTN|nr:LytR C-terminal domain-containing protein [Kineosporia mesophila]MCD5350879.1 LytR C-terminal domain-containing protein [Kineosporia mesophila]